MNKYVVGFCNLISNETKVVFVNADNEIEAMILAVGDTLDDFVDINFENTDAVQEYYFDGEISVSLPVEID